VSRPWVLLCPNGRYRHILRFSQNAAKLRQRQRFSRIIIGYPCMGLLRLQGRRGGAITEAVDDFCGP